MSKDSQHFDSNKTFLNAHNGMLGIAIVLLIIAVIGLISLCGVQTGSSNTSGCGSAIQSSTGGEENGQINPTTEVVAEFFIVLFTVIGVAMLTYVLTIKKASSKLIEKNQKYAAIIINGNKTTLTKEQIESIQGDELKQLVSDVGLPSNTISMGLKAIKSGANSASKPKPKSDSESDKKGDSSDEKD